MITQCFSQGNIQYNTTVFRILQEFHIFDIITINQKINPIMTTHDYSKTISISIQIQINVNVVSVFFLIWKWKFGSKRNLKGKYIPVRVRAIDSHFAVMNELIVFFSVMYCLTRKFASAAQNTIVSRHNGGPIKGSP